MKLENQAGSLSEAELRELVPQLQQMTEKYKRAEAIQKALFDISELSSAVSELSRLYSAVHDIIAGFMHARNFYVAFYDESEQMMDFVYFVDEFDELTVNEMPASQLKHGFSGYVIETGNHLFLTQENYDEKIREIGVKNLGTRPVDWIGVPLKRGNRVIGVMAVQSYDEAVRYTHHDLDVLLFVSQHIVTTVDRVKNRELTEKTIRQRTKQLREINNELQEEIRERQKIEALQQALFEISELSATMEGDIPDFYASLHDILARLIHAPNLYIATLDKERNFLRFPYFNDEKTKAARPRPLGNGLTEYVLRNGHAELIDARRAKQLADSGDLAPDLAARMDVSHNSWIGAPLIVDGEVSGVIGIQAYNDDYTYSFKDLELLRFVSHHIAVALERKKAAEAIQEYNHDLTRRVKERTQELDETNEHLKKQIEERKQIELKLIHDAHHDALTGLPNRAMFMNRLELALANKQRFSDNKFAVLFIDLDRFKLINDTLGHYAGDKFLIEVSIRVDQCIRGHDLLARLGGDEFVILLDNFEDDEDVEEVSLRILESLSKAFCLDGSEMYSGGSIGIAYVEPWYQNADEIIRDADAAMYQAKSLGRGRYVMFDQSMREKLLEELELENEFRRTLKLNSFHCHYQPVLHMGNNDVIYHECYVRWVHSTIGPVKKDQFLRIIEHSGMTTEMDNFMVEKACQILLGQEETPFISQTDKVAINLSVNHLMQAKLVNELIEKVMSSGISPERLVIEIDESLLSRKSQQILSSIKMLKKAGVKLVLDNFGNGLASLNYLCSYPFDYVKFDRKFVRSIPGSEQNLKLIQSVQQISQHFGFQLIAEGIQSSAQCEALVSIGCELGQGTFLAETQGKLPVASENPSQKKMAELDGSNVISLTA